MTGLPHSISEQWRGAARAVPIKHGLDRLLDLFEERLDTPEEQDLEALDDFLPLSTGLVGLDHVLGGGLRRGEVAWVEANLPSQAAAVARASAGATPHICLLDSGDVLSSVARLVAGASGVPWSGVWAAWMSEKEWSATSAAISRFARRDLSLSAIGSVRTLRRVIRDLGPDLVIIDEPAHLGGPSEIIDELVDIAGSTQVGVLICAHEALPEEAVDGRSRVRRVSMSSLSLGGAALLLGPDCEDMLAFRQVRVDLQRGQVW